MDEKLDALAEHLAAALPSVVQDYAIHHGELSVSIPRESILEALTFLQQRHNAGEVVTGLLFVEPDHGDLHQFLDTVDTPLNELGEAALCPGQDILAKYNAAHR